MFVLTFKGETDATKAVEELRQAVNFLLSDGVLRDRDEVVVLLESKGGSVDSYGLGAAQLQRLSRRGRRTAQQQQSTDSIAAVAAPTTDSDADADSSKGKHSKDGEISSSTTSTSTSDGNGGVGGSVGSSVGGSVGPSLTVCVDRVAASGGYMMASVADRVVCAPFAYLGSIGVFMHLRTRRLSRRGTSHRHSSRRTRKRS